MTRNELRKQCQLAEVTGSPMMDEFLVPQGLVPIDMAGMGGAPQDGDLDKLVGGIPPNQAPNKPPKAPEDKDDPNKDDPDKLLPKPAKTEPTEKRD